MAPTVARRGLTSTGETIAAVGLVLVPMSGYALHGTALLGGPSVPEPSFLGVTFALTAVFAFAYAGVSRLAAPRYATVLALQPVPPLLAYAAIESPAGWAARAHRRRRGRPAPAHHADPRGPAGAALAVRPPRAG